MLIVGVNITSNDQFSSGAGPGKFSSSRSIWSSVCKPQHPTSSQRTTRYSLVHASNCSKETGIAEAKIAGEIPWRCHSSDFGGCRVDLLVPNQADGRAT